MQLLGGIGAAPEQRKSGLPAFWRILYPKYLHRRNYDVVVAEDWRPSEVGRGFAILQVRNNLSCFPRSYNPANADVKRSRAM